MRPTIQLCAGEAIPLALLAPCDGEIHHARLCHPRIDAILIEAPFVVPSDTRPCEYELRVSTDCGCFSMYVSVTCAPVFLPGTFTGEKTRTINPVCCPEEP